MKLEIAVLAQSLERIAIELQRCRACLADLLAESVASTSLPPVAPAPIATPDMPRPPRRRQTRLYASGELAQRVLALMAEADELSIQELLRALQRLKPGTQMASLRPCITNLVQDGQLVWVRKGVYRLPERKPHLSVVER